jgi:NADPH:quinone reductase-like Zn-dependent oxidoreductase
MMKAVFFESHGGTDVLRYGDLPDPRPGAGEVVIQIKAAALNFNDIWARQGMPGLAVPLPHVSGSDAAGIIVELGQGVSNWRLGDEVVIDAIQSCRVCAACLSGQEVFCRDMKVWGFQTGPNDGSFAQYAKVQIGQLLPKPKRLSWTDAAATPSALGSVWRMLVTRAKVQPGESVLLFGASGGTGSFAVQLVKAMGGVAIAVTSSERKEIFCRELGADHVIRSDKQDVVQEVKRLTGRRGVDVVFDHAGCNTWQQGVAALTWGGRLVICGATEGFDAKIDLRHLWNKQLSLLGSHTCTFAEFMASARLLEEGRIKPFVTEVIGLQDIGDAQTRMQNRQTMGKIAIEISH